MNVRMLFSLMLAVAVTGCGDRGESGATPGVDPASKTVTIGMLNDESGPVAGIGRPFAVGKRMLAKQINAGGSGLLPEGWKLELIERDHGYNPQRSVQLFNEIRDQVLFIGTSFGTPNTLPLRPMLTRNQIVAFPASLSSKMAEFEYTPPLGPSYKKEVGRALDWMIERAGGADKVKLGLVYQQDDYGQDGLEATTEVARQLQLALVSTQAYAAGQADYTAVVAALKKAGATHVMLTTVPSATSPLLGVAAQLDYKPVWVGNSPSWLDRFFDPQVVPSAVFANYYWVTASAYWGEEVPFMPGFLAAYEQFGKDMAPPDYYILVSYVQGATEVEIVKRMIESGKFSRAAFLQTLKGLKDYTSGGAFPEPLDFTQMPYVVGTKTRVLKPDFARKSWSVVGDYAAPSAKVP